MKYRTSHPARYRLSSKDRATIEHGMMSIHRDGIRSMGIHPIRGKRYSIIREDGPLMVSGEERFRITIQRGETQFDISAVVERWDA